MKTEKSKHLLWVSDSIKNSEYSSWNPGSGGNALGIKQNNPVGALKGQPNDVRR
ncbi:MAG: hypothetical protein LBS88_01200 [Tannerellaceae bacterium]|jgi:hypothetical protein|nr:hypothetical protein [Tannerellaceae bacterium]